MEKRVRRNGVMPITTNHKFFGKPTNYPLFFIDLISKLKYRF